VLAEKDRLSITEVTAPEDLAQLRDEWTGLLRRSPSATPFQSPEWIITWWKYFGEGQLRVIVLRSEGRLAGLAPLFITPPVPGKERSVRIIGTGITDYLDFLLEPGLERRGASLILAHLESTASEWDLCDFQELRPESILLEVPFPDKLHTCRLIQEECPVLVLPSTLEEYYENLPRSFITRLVRAKKSLTRAEKTELVKADSSTLPYFMNELFRLHGASWGVRNQKGVLFDNRIRSFHIEVAAAFMKRGLLSLYGLLYGEKLIALIYALSSGFRLYFYIGGFDPEFGRSSPGTVLMSFVIEAAIGDGFREIDFLRGKEKYKFNWGASSRTNHRVLAWHSGFSGPETTETDEYSPALI
jgi:CelD/BcsL family acetyltransferase involved in cellulose biosynthesis